MTTLFYKTLLLQGEIWCWSLLGFKGLITELSYFLLSHFLYIMWNWASIDTLALRVQLYWHKSVNWILIDRTSRFSTQAERLKNNPFGALALTYCTGSDAYLLLVVPFYPWFSFWFSFVFSILLDQGDPDRIVLKSKINNRSHLSCLLYADDLVLMSQSDEGLENALFILSEYREHWLSSLNPKKTKIMICEKKYRKLTLFSYQ